jgi:hypothetical protein
MKLLLMFSRAIDALNEHVGKLSYWLILAAVLIAWGIYTWLRARTVVPPRTRLAMRIGGGSVTLVGSLMAALAWAPFTVAGLLLGAAGAVFVLRGLVSAAILAWPF